MNRLRTTIVIVAAAALTCAGCSGSVDSPARTLADTAAKSISRGDTRTVTEMMHFPPTYTPEERQADMLATGRGLDLMVTDFGAITGLKSNAGSGLYYEVGGSGGDVPYLSSLSPNASASFLYKAKFAKYGEGTIRVMVIQLKADSPYEVLGIYFGLPASNPRSKPALLDLSRKQLEQMHVTITPEIERQMAESLKPVRFPM